MASQPNPNGSTNEKSLCNATQPDTSSDVIFHVKALIWENTSAM